jgi:hypothetical protein
MNTIASFEHFIACAHDSDVNREEIEAALRQARESARDAGDGAKGEWQHIIVQIEDILADRAMTAP